MTETEVLEGLRVLRVHHLRQFNKTRRKYETFNRLCETSPTKRNRYNAAHCGRMMRFHANQVDLLNTFFNTTAEQDAERYEQRERAEQGGGNPQGLQRFGDDGDCG